MSPLLEVSRCRSVQLSSSARRILRPLPVHARLHFRFGQRILPPTRGSGAPTGALFKFCRACEARPPCPGATGTPLGAPPWRFSAGNPRRPHRQWHRGRQQLVRSRAMRPGGRGLEPPAVRFAPPPRDATPGSVCRSSPEMSPPELGCKSSTIYSLRSQYIIHHEANNLLTGRKDFGRTLRTVRTGRGNSPAWFH
jgi:hypothetical protein